MVQDYKSQCYETFLLVMFFFFFFLSIHSQRCLLPMVFLKLFIHSSSQISKFQSSFQDLKSICKMPQKLIQKDIMNDFTHWLRSLHIISTYHRTHSHASMCYMDVNRILSINFTGNGEKVHLWWGFYFLYLLMYTTEYHVI